MDVCESEQALPKHKAVETPRPPLVPAEKNNAVTSRRSRTREVSSRYKSPIPGTPSGTRRFPSPNPRAMSASSQLLPKRLHSGESRRPSSPPSPRTPSTPVHESSVDVQLSSRRTASRLPEHLWPSTMRSLGVSFQSDTISIPVTKKEKPIPSASDRTLRLTSNVAHRPAETLTIRKPTPERMRSPLKGKNASDQSENSKPVDSLHSRLIDQHRWPSRIGGIGKTSSNALNRSVDLADKTVRTLSTPVPGTALSSLRRLSQPEEVNNTLQKSSSDSVRLISCVENGSIETEAKSASDNILLAASAVRSQSLPIAGSPLPSPIKTSVQSSSSERSDNILLAASAVRSQSLPIPGSPLPSPIKTSVLSSSSERSNNILSATSAVRSQSLPSPKSRLPSPIKTSVLSSSSARGVSPSRSRPSTPPSRGVSPSRIGQTDTSSQANSLISVFNIITDYKKAKKGAADAHHLRLLHNRYLQWRFANARAEALLYIQKATVEKTLYNVWNTLLSLRDSVIRKRFNLQQLKLELKLNSVLNDQMAYLDDWALLEIDHVDVLSRAVEDLEASTLRLPLAGRAKADIEQLKIAICSAVDVMLAMGSAIFSLLTRAEGMNSLISELALVAAQEKAMVDECEVLLASAAAMQAEENSLRAHLLQVKQSLRNLSTLEADLLLS